MALTLDLTPDLEARLHEEAARRGKRAEDLARLVVAEWLERPSAARISGTKDEVSEAERRRRMRETLDAARDSARSSTESLVQLEAEVHRACEEVRTAHYERRRRQDTRP